MASKPHTSLTYHAYQHLVGNLSSLYEPTNVVEALNSDSWCQAMLTVRTLLSLASMKSWLVFQMDATNAFLYGDLEDKVFMSLPPTYNHIKRVGISGNDACPQGGYLMRSSYHLLFVCKLNKFLYE